MSNIWATHGHTTMHYLQLLNKGYNNKSLFIQAKPHTQRHKKGYKTRTCDGTTNKITPSSNNKQFAICHLEWIFAASSVKMFNRWATHGHTTRHYLQLLDEGYDHQSLFIQFKPHTWRHKKGCETPTCDGTTNKTRPIDNNKQSTICH